MRDQLFNKRAALANRCVNWGNKCVSNPYLVAVSVKEKGEPRPREPTPYLSIAYCLLLTDTPDSAITFPDRPK